MVTKGNTDKQSSEIKMHILKELDEKIVKAQETFTKTNAEITEKEEAKKSLDETITKLKVDKLKLEESKIETGKYFDERCHLENLLNTRFNYLIVIFGLIIGGILTVKTTFGIMCLAGVGTVIVFILTIVIAHTHKRFCIILEYLEHQDGAIKYGKEHLKKLPSYDFRKYSVKNNVGYWIPILMLVIMILSLIFQTQILENTKDNTESENKKMIDSLSSDLNKKILDTHTEIKFLNHRIDSIANAQKHQLREKK
jgi:hypothetical protein